MTEEDYNKFLEGGGDAAELLKKYLSKEEGANLESWDKEEVTFYINKWNGKSLKQVLIL